MKKRRLRARHLKELAILLLLVGAVVAAIAGRHRHPGFGELQPTQGRLDGVESIRSGRYSWEPVLIIDGQRYVYRGPRQLFEGLAPRAALTAWSRPVGAGLRELWQLSSEGHVVVAYQETLTRARARDRRLEILGSAIAALGVAFGAVGWLAERRRHEHSAS